MKHSTTLAFAVALAAMAPALALTLTLAPHAARADDPPQHQAKLSMDDARAKALRLVPGKIVHEELENESKRWIYSFEIRPADEKRRLVKEVNIDADTGAVVGIDTENE